MEKKIWKNKDNEEKKIRGDEGKAVGGEVAR